MSATIVGTKAILTELSGDAKIVVITATVGSASDTIAITEALHGISAVDAIVSAHITSGADADFKAVQVTRTSATSLTVVSTEGDGTPSDAWTVGISITVIGH